MMPAPGTSMHDASLDRGARRQRTMSRIGAVCIGLAASYVVALHWQHLASVVPVLLLLACPLMHLLHRHGPGHDRHH